MSDELKPCPFCNSKNVTVIIDDYFDAVACRDCEASGPTGKRVPAAIKAWNERPEMADNATLRQSLADQDAEIQRLRGEVARLTAIVQDAWVHAPQKPCDTSAPYESVPASAAQRDVNGRYVL